MKGGTRHDRRRFIAPGVTLAEGFSPTLKGAESRVPG
jgi:hypothetical protein